MHDLTRCVQHSLVSHEGFASLAVPTYRASVEEPGELWADLAGFLAAIAAT